MKFGMKIIIIFLLIMVWFLLFVMSIGTSSATTLTVDDDGGADYETIKDALEAAEDGDTIYVYNGLYKDKLAINTRVDIVGESRDAKIYCMNDNYAVYINEDWVNLTNLHIYGGPLDYSMQIRSDNCTISNCSIGGANRMGAELFTANDVTIENCTVIGSYGLAVDHSDFTTIQNSTISNAIFEDSSNNYYRKISGDGSRKHQISLLRSHGNRIENADVYRLRITEANNNTMINCTVSNFEDDHGIEVTDSSYNIIRENIISYNDRHGVYIHGESSYNRILWNELVHNNGTAIHAFGESTEIANNFISSNYHYDHGISVVGANQTISGNDLYHSGITYYLSLEEAIISANIDDSNTVNGRPLYFLKNLNGFSVPQDAGQVIIINCTDGLVEGLNCSNSSYGIQVYLSSKITVINNQCMDCIIGIILVDSDNMTVRGNICSCTTNIGYSINCRSIRDSVIENNDCSSVRSSRGIWVYQSSGVRVSANHVTHWIGVELIQSHNNIIRQNICVDNNVESMSKGILVEECSDNVIVGNTLSSFDYGMWLEKSFDNIYKENVLGYSDNYGIYLTRSNENLFFSNTITKSEYGGLYMSSSSYNTIVGNTISQSNNGIYVTSSSLNNIISNNNIVNSGELAVENTKNSEINAGNNWWGDKTGPYHPDQNPDGQGDEVSDLVIFEPWLTGSFVYYEPSTIIRSITPEDPIDDEPLHLVAEIDASVPITNIVWISSIDGVMYDGPEEEVDIPPLSPGTHTITLLTMDLAGVWAQDRTTTITVNGRPDAEIISITPSPSKLNETVTFTGKGFDDGTITRYSWHSSLNGSIYNGTESAFETADLHLGNHSISLVVQDDLGIWSEEAFVWLEVKEDTQVENQRPTVTITAPSDGKIVKETIMITGNASDPDGTVQRVEVSINGGEWQSAQGTESWSFQWDTMKVENGVYTIRIHSHDGMNHSVEKTISVKVENEGEEGEDGGGEGGFIPGFEAVSIISCIGIVFILTLKKGKVIGALVPFIPFTSDWIRIKYREICTNLFI